MLPHNGQRASRADEIKYQIAKRFKSKENLYVYLKSRLVRRLLFLTTFFQGYCLPGLHNTPLGFIQDVFVENSPKRLFLETEINHMPVPKLAEFSVKRLWRHAVKNERFRQAVPDSWGPGHRTAEREYFLKILATVEPAWLWNNIQRIQELRVSRRALQQAK